MDMKKILQAIDSGSTKPVGNSNDMKKFLSVVTEGANTHKVALPVQMAMQHYSTPTVGPQKFWTVNNAVIFVNFFKALHVRRSQCAFNHNRHEKWNMI